MKEITKKRAFRAVVFFIVLAVLVFLFPLFYHCPIYSTLGIPCPGCGMTRAMKSVLQLDFIAAFRWHPLFGVTIAAALFIGWAYVFDRMELVRSKQFLWGICLLFLAVWFIRLALMFLTDYSILTINENALLPRIWQGLHG